PRRRDASLRPVFLGVFGQPETDPRVEVDGVLNFGGEHVEVVEPLRMAALVEIVAAQQMRALLHRCIEFDLEAERIGELQRAALERLLRKRVCYPVLRKKGGCLVEIVLVADLESQAVAGGARRLAQHQRVMLMLLAAAQVHRLFVAILSMQPDGVFVKLAAGIQIHHVKDEVAAPDDVERRIENMLRDGHAVSSIRRRQEYYHYSGMRALMLRPQAARECCCASNWFPCR